MTRIVASAPGSIMLTGEHAVVYGHPAMVAAIDQRATVTVEPTTDGQLQITSSIADPVTYPMDALPTDGTYRFLTAVISRYRQHLTDGMKITVTSDIDPTLGLGSSAAVTVACLGALKQLIGIAPDNLHDIALMIVRAIQGRGSGADLAASLHGGLLAYQLDENGMSPATITPLPAPPPLSLRYTGYKTPTAEVLATVAEGRKGREAVIDDLYARMGANADIAIAAAQTGDWGYVGMQMNDYQVLMAELGVSDATIDGIVTEAFGLDGLLACKISGSGLGDCVLAVGAVPPGFQEVPLATQGLMIHDAS